MLTTYYKAGSTAEQETCKQNITASTKIIKLHNKGEWLKVLSLLKRRRDKQTHREDTGNRSEPGLEKDDYLDRKT